PAEPDGGLPPGLGGWGGAPAGPHASRLHTSARPRTACNARPRRVIGASFSGGWSGASRLGLDHVEQHAVRVGQVALAVVAGLEQPQAALALGAVAKLHRVQTRVAQLDVLHV